LELQTLSRTVKRGHSGLTGTHSHTRTHPAGSSGHYH